MENNAGVLHSDSPPQGVPVARVVRGRSSHYRICAIDDHPLFCDGLRSILQEEGDLELVAQASHGSSALAMVRQHQPDVILLDIFLPGSNGLDLVRHLFRICPHAKIVVITGQPEHELLTKALRLGVHAFLQKDMGGTAIVNTLRAVLRGERVIGRPETLAEALAEFGQLLRERERERFGLTEDEVEMLRLAAEGLKNKEIGARQFWSEITVKRKMQDIYRKLEVTSRAQAVAEAIRLGII